jgi:tetratricopeptide (TPR) repeat protein
MAGDRIDFFVSHAGADRAWAEWVAWHLIKAGYTVELDVWDWPTGQNFVTSMSDALDRCDRVLALVSLAYFDRSRYTTNEWSAAVAQDRGVKEGRLVLVRVDNVPVEVMPAVLRPLISCDVFGVDAEQARRVLLAAVAGPQRPDGEPVFPGRTAPGPLGRAPRFPGGVLRMVNVPPRNRAFTGREGVLAELGRRLEAEPVAVVAVRGLGGVGKSQVALEYAYRMCESGRYELAGWVRADSAVTVAGDLAKMAPLLGIDSDRPAGELAAAVVAALGSRRDWLVVFDNAQTPDDLVGMLPRGGGHILITSRNRVWNRIARQVDLGEFSRAESVQFVCDRSGSDEAEAASELAEELGDLPLALAQAADYIDTRAMTVRSYLDSYRNPVRAQRLRDAGLDSAEYPESVARTWLMSFSQLSKERPAAADLLRLCAFLDPDDIDLDLLSTGRAEFDTVLAMVFDDQERIEAVGALAARSLVTVPVQGHLRVHRLVQAVTRDQLDGDQFAEWAERALGLVAAILPPEPGDYRSWPTYAKLAPHIEAVTRHAISPFLRTGKIDLLRKLGNYLSESEQLRAARITIENVLEIQEAVSCPDDPEVVKTLDNLGAIQLKLGELGEARAVIERALPVLRREYGSDNLEVAKALGNLGIIQLDLWELENARTNLEQALAIFLAYGPDHRDLTHTYVNLGSVQLRLGELVNARASFERALDISEAADRPDHPQAVKALIGLGGVQMRQGELRSARASAERALRISEDVYGPGNPEVAKALINLGAVQTRQGELRKARANLERALSSLELVYGPNHPEAASALVYLGAAQLELGKLRDARASIERALVIREAVYDRDHPEVGSALINLGVAQLRLGDLEDACASLQRALAISETVHGSNHLEAASALVPLSIAQLRLGELRNACASLQRALEISEAISGPSHPEVTKGLIAWWSSRCG